VSYEKIATCSSLSTPQRVCVRPTDSLPPTLPPSLSPSLLPSLTHSLTPTPVTGLVAGVAVGNMLPTPGAKYGRHRPCREWRRRVVAAAAAAALSWALPLSPVQVEYPHYTLLHTLSYIHFTAYTSLALTLSPVHVCNCRGQGLGFRV
jgi:hypothetical protein